MNTRHHNTKTQSPLSGQKCFGGTGARVFTFHLLEPYISSDISHVSTTAHFRYLDHVSDIQLLNYPEDQYIHTSIPLHIFCGLIPLSKARKVASIHGASVGSRCTVVHLLASTENHSCLACSKYSSVFVANKNSAQLGVDRVLKSRKVHTIRKKSKKFTDQPASSDFRTKTKNTTDLATEFPPTVADNDLCHTIALNVCKKMNKSNIEEAGCAVCSELTPVRNLS